MCFSTTIVSIVVIGAQAGKTLHNKVIRALLWTLQRRHWRAAAVMQTVMEDTTMCFEELENLVLMEHFGDDLTVIWLLTYLAKWINKSLSHTA